MASDVGGATEVERGNSMAPRRPKISTQTSSNYQLARNRQEKIFQPRAFQATNAPDSETMFRDPFVFYKQPADVGIPCQPSLEVLSALWILYSETEIN
jgi:hypothetical protein